MLEKISTDILKQLKNQKVKEVFGIQDIDQNGFISRDELQFVMKTKGGVKVTDRQVRKIIKEADEDDDGQISYDEFVKLIENISIEDVLWWESLPQKLCHGRKRKKFFKLIGLSM
ncbi:EF-hand domain-containing protein [Hirschfeldia incana]|nr:EF-hand domain-containing protein [Hirschfeldia incana]